LSCTLSERKNEKQVKFFIDEKEREQFKLLCDSAGISASSVLRMWIRSAVEKQELNCTAPPEGRRHDSALPVVSASNDETITALMQRLNKVERIYNYINEQELDFIKNEVLGDEFGTIRNRVGVIESQLQDMGGTIAWKKD